MQPKPRGMFRPLCGGPEDIPGVPASEPPRPGLPLWPWRCCWPPVAAETSLPPTRTNRPAPTTSASPKPASRAQQDLGQTSLLRLGFRNTGEKTVPVAGGDDLDRRRAGRDLLAAVRRSTIPRPDWPSPTGRSGCWPRPTPACTAPRTPGGAATSNPQDLRLRAAEARRDGRRGLEAERGQSRPLHAPLQGRRRPRRQGQGRDQQRHRPRGLLRDRDHRGPAGTPK